jgi:hypothetical protein
MPDLDAAISTYWSLLRVGVSEADVATAWAAAAEAVWKDELYVADGRASFLFNSGQVRMTVCECTLRTATLATGVPHFLTVVLEESFGLNLGWALHTRTLDAISGAGWENPSFGAEALRSWTSFRSA